MLQILTRVPFFVWPLFVLLLIGGIKASKKSLMPLGMLLIFPAIFSIVSIFSFYGKFGNLFSLVLWFVCVALGFSIGFFHMQRLQLRFEKRKVELPGSWIPLMLSMSIFSSKFYLGMLSEIAPHLNGSNLVLGLELFSAVILGIFAGRGIGCLLRYRSEFTI